METKHAKNAKHALAEKTTQRRNGPAQSQATEIINCRKPKSQLEKANQTATETARFNAENIAQIEKTTRSYTAGRNKARWL